MMIPAAPAAAAPASTAIVNGAPCAAADAEREVDHAHDPEHERQPRGDQEDHHAEL
jgi:hypothetical protein